MTENLSNQQDPALSASASHADLREPAVLLSMLIAALLGAYLLLTSTRDLIPGIWPYDAKRILQFVLLFILFLVPALNGRIRMEFGALLAVTPAWIKATLLAVLFWGILSALLNAQSLMHALSSLSEVALLSALALGIFVVAACRRVAGRAFDRVAIGMLAMTGLAVGLQELIGVLAAHNAGLDFNFSVYLLHFSWPRFYNQVQSWMVPALVALPVLFARYRLAWFICALALGLQWFIIVMTEARGSFVSLAAALVFALVFLPPVRRRLFAWQATGLAAGVIVFILVALSFEAGQDAGTGQISGARSSFFNQSVGRPMIGTSGRAETWRTTLEDVRQHPLLGIGPMNYACTSPKPFGHPHNFPLQLAAEWGIPVSLAICTLFLVLLWQASQRVRKYRMGSPENAIIAGLLLTGILAAALHACVSGVMVMPASQVTGLLICGMLLGLYPPVPGHQKNRTSRGWATYGLVITIFLLGLGAYELHTMKARSALLEPKTTMWPRIWQDAKTCRLYLEQNEVSN